MLYKILHDKLMVSGKKETEKEKQEKIILENLDKEGKLNIKEDNKKPTIITVNKVIYKKGKIENKKDEEQNDNNENYVNEDTKNEENNTNIRTKNYYSNYNYNYSMSYYKKVKRNMYYSNPKRKRMASFNVKKSLKYIKGDDDYFNIALDDRDDTNIYTEIVNDIINNDYVDNYNERNKTIVNIKEEKIEEDKEEKKEIKKKKRRNTNKVEKKTKEKKSKKDVIIKEDGKTIIKASGARNLKELLG